MGTLAHSRAFPPAHFLTVVRPNFDTLYTTAWLDLTNGPYVIALPAMEGRFFMLPLYDMWTDVFASPGTRTNGTAAFTIAICAPEWRGTLPEGVARIDATTRRVWVIGRTETRGPADYGAVHALQDAMAMAPLATWPHFAPPPDDKDPSLDTKTPPMRKVDQMSSAEFFATAARLVATERPHATDWGMVTRLARVGLRVGEPFAVQAQSGPVIEAFTGAPGAAQREMASRARAVAPSVDGWIASGELGVYANNYLRRAMTARWGLGANPPEESIYPNLERDAQGSTLDGTYRYLLRFEAGGLPPVDAFWSLTVYDRQGFHVANEIDRFALGDRDELIYGADGSLEILLAHERPSDEWVANWLPVPAEGFMVTLRLYLPREDAVTQRWTAPAAVRLG